MCVHNTRGVTSALMRQHAKNASAPMIVIHIGDPRRGKDRSINKNSAIFNGIPLVCYSPDRYLPEPPGFFAPASVTRPWSKIDTAALPIGTCFGVYVSFPSSPFADPFTPPNVSGLPSQSTSRHTVRIRSLCGPSVYSADPQPRY